MINFGMIFIVSVNGFGSCGIVVNGFQKVIYDIFITFNKFRNPRVIERYPLTRFCGLAKASILPMRLFLTKTIVGDNKIILPGTFG